MSTPPPPPSTPSLSLPWRFSSSLIMGLTGSLSRGFLFGMNRTEVVGLDRFLETLDNRKNVEGRARGLITVSNHVSVIDDPLIWGVLPFKYAFSPSNHRWSLGSYDICFQNKFLSSFFTYGQVLPTHRGDYSPIHGGLFQPTITQAIRLLSSQPFTKTLSTETSHTISDPFSGSSLTYSTTGADNFPAPSAYPSRRHSWVHIFPEGRVHQHPTKSLRYFKWGVSRLILESEPLPDIIPIFIDGNQHIMHEAREWPRFVPRVGKDKDALVKKGLPTDLEMGELSEGLKYCNEAVALRKEVTRRIRLEVLKVRRELGYPDEDPKEGLVETWIEEGGKKTGKMEDGSYVGET
ncbi:Lysophosphatidylcholine acyltransferase [Lachnellula subtilissima]|uniref:Tafazzin family protein n=1 Tax=Lachnellula subtilissima TaxID=602034 RepID=A0A8H8RBU8_9HELO|nr:Lysophosphatidylcholine acyltransferase [Lachnellula subtilissima]